MERRTPFSQKALQPKEVAALEYREGFCPHCQQQMVATECDGVPAWFCAEHSTALPMKEI